MLHKHHCKQYRHISVDLLWLSHNNKDSYIAVTSEVCQNLLLFDDQLVEIHYHFPYITNGKLIWSNGSSSYGLTFAIVMLLGVGSFLIVVILDKNKHTQWFLAIHTSRGGGNVPRSTAIKNITSK